MGGWLVTRNIPHCVRLGANRVCVGQAIDTTIKQRVGNGLSNTRSTTQRESVLDLIRVQQEFDTVRVRATRQTRSCPIPAVLGNHCERQCIHVVKKGLSWCWSHIFLYNIIIANNFQKRMMDVQTRTVWRTLEEKYPKVRGPT